MHYAREKKGGHAVNGAIRERGGQMQALCNMQRYSDAMHRRILRGNKRGENKRAIHKAQVKLERVKEAGDEKPIDQPIGKKKVESGRE